jgi:tetratricopeptide (TPR) repeat protein
MVERYRRTRHGQLSIALATSCLLVVFLSSSGAGAQGEDTRANALGSGASDVPGKGTDGAITENTGSGNTSKKSTTTGPGNPGEARGAEEANAPDANVGNRPSLRIDRQLGAAGDLMVEGRYADAADIYQQILTIAPDNVEALAGYGMSLGRQNKLDEADTQFDKVISLAPNNAVAHCGKAMVLLNRLQSAKDSSGKSRNQLLKEAGLECNRALDADPRVVEAHYLLGKVYREENRLNMAEQAFSGAVKLDPHYSNAWVALGMVQLQHEKYGPAQETFKQAISVNPSNSSAYFGLGQLYMKQNQMDRAVRELNMSIYKNPNHPEVHLTLGKAYEAQGENVAAVKEFQEAIKLKPDYSEAYLAMANNFESRGELDNAIYKLRPGLQVLPKDPALRLFVAKANLRAGRLDEAIADYQAVLGNGPPANTLVEAAEGLVRCFYVRSLRETTGGFLHAGDFQRAKALLAQLEQTNPESLELKFAAAELAALGGDSPNLDIIGAPKTDSERLALAEAYLAEHRFSEADDLFKKLIYSATKPRDAFALADYAFLVRDLDAAESAFKKGYTFATGDVRAKQGLEAVQKMRQLSNDDFAQGDEMEKRHLYDQAVIRFHGAIYGDPRHADAHLGLAQCLEKVTAAQPQDAARNFREAINQYKLYLQLSPSLAAHQADRVSRKISRLDEQARKLDTGAATVKSASDRVSSTR